MASLRNTATHQHHRAPRASIRKAADPSSQGHSADLEAKIATQVKTQLDLAQCNVLRGLKLKEIIYVTMTFLLLVCSWTCHKILTFIIYYVTQCLRLQRDRDFQVEALPGLLGDVGLHPPQVQTATTSTQTESPRMRHCRVQVVPATATLEIQTDFNINDESIQTDKPMDVRENY